MSLGKSELWLGFYVLKLLVAFFAIAFLGDRVQLGDSESYLEGVYADWTTMFGSSTNLVGTIAYYLNQYFGLYITTAIFSALSWFGIYYPASRLNLSTRQLLILLCLLSIPSFAVWSSLVSKEAFVIVGFGLVLGYAIDFLSEKNRVGIFPLLFGCAVIGFFKPHYLYSVVFFLLFVVLGKHCYNRGAVGFFAFVLYLLVTAVALYIFGDILNWFAGEIPNHFDPAGGSTRDNTFFINDGDIYRVAPYGVFISLFGPTMSEAVGSPFLLLVFFESLFLLIVFIVLMCIVVVKGLVKGRFSIYFALMFVVVASALVLVNYPFGLFNPGSAIRYRTGFYPFLVILCCYCFVSDKMKIIKLK